MKKEFNVKFQKIFSSSISLVVSIITFLIGFFAIGKTAFFNLVINLSSESCFIKPDNIFLNIFSFLLVLALLYLLFKKILPKLNSKILLILVLCFSLLIGFWWINYLKLKPISDQSMVVYCAEKILDNDLKPILEPGNYLSRNPHQLGFVLYIATIFKIFSTRNIIVIQNISIIFSATCIITLYFIIKELFEEETVHKIALIFIGFFSIYFMFFSPHVYGNLPGLAFGLIAILFTLKFLKSNKLWHLAITAISITCAYLLKNNYEIFLIAIIIELSLMSLKDLKIKPIIGIGIILLTVFCLKTVIYTCTELATEYKLDNGVPITTYIYMGIAEPQTLGPGWYTGDVEGIYNESRLQQRKSQRNYE